MSVMHEEVHQGTRQQQQKGQRAKYMRAMLREQGSIRILPLSRWRGKRHKRPA
jgi:3'-phosphoadenosine 5'-phosphosulfate sulfotransferase (PAPS reductase)/FAD synthetase